MLGISHKNTVQYINYILAWMSAIYPWFTSFKLLFQTGDLEQLLSYSTLARYHVSYHCISNLPPMPEDCATNLNITVKIIFLI